jgi:hypothetical protein
MKRQLPMMTGIALALLVTGFVLWMLTKPVQEIKNEDLSLFGSNPETVSPEERFMPDEQETDTSPPEGFERYTNEAFRFSFVHEEGAVLRTFDEGNGAATITLEDETRGHALQVYVLPYREKQIGQDRFLLDLPSGVRKNEEAIMIAGVPAVAFISEVAMVGSTREVWLLHGGRLYEISVPLPMEAWLLTLLPTFRFL